MRICDDDRPRNSIITQKLRIVPSDKFFILFALKENATAEKVAVRLCQVYLV